MINKQKAREKCKKRITVIIKEIQNEDKKQTKVGNIDRPSPKKFRQCKISNISRKS